ncbi:MAG TPA: 4-hydroxy-tetrahydrodipicolinate reductase [Syntrophus sp. (in: bacteria)]|nr:4-hydroxy-tetrahydrodipicolinate reductase [Syntrophus sp. (in: bacteria)]
MIKAIVMGAGGRMGGRISSLIAATEGVEVVSGVEIKGHPIVGKDMGEMIGFGKSGKTIVDDLKKVIDSGDVIIDFTQHESSLQNFELAAKKGKPIVIGTTGFTTEELKMAQKLAKKTPCVLAPNMSVGVNVMFKVLENVATILGNDYDVEIVEAHHNLKKDAPSGTAMKMAQIVAAALDRNLDKEGIYTRKGMIGERSKTEIGIQTIRGGDIVGEHNVMFVTNGERLEFIHRAHNRDNFARGAIRAAKWVISQKNGLYDMQDVLGLRTN